MKFIYDYDELKKFHALLKPLEGDEVYFISASGRNKYLTPDERIELDLGRTEMFSRKIITKPQVEEYIRAIESYEIETGLSGRGYKPLPGKCLILYANINNSSSKKALQEFYTTTMKLLFEGGGREGPESFRYIHTHLLNAYQRNRSYKTWIDIDTDCKNHKDIGYSILESELFAGLDQLGAEYRVVETRSGYHTLIKRGTVKGNFHVFVLAANTKIQEIDSGYECVHNSNEMLGIPGTMGAGFPIKIIK